MRVGPLELEQRYYGLLFAVASTAHVHSSRWRVSRNHSKNRLCFTKWCEQAGSTYNFFFFPIPKEQNAKGITNNRITTIKKKKIARLGNKKIYKIYIGKDHDV